MKRLRSAAACIGVTLVLSGGIVVAATSETISRPYSASGDVRKGSLVSLAGGSSRVQPTNITNDDKLLGVVVAADDSLLAVNAEKGKVQVVTGGNALAMVSTINGDIKSGDPIVSSPFNGIGAKGINGAEAIVGLAQSSLNDSTEGITNQTVADKQGKMRQVHVGYVRINVTAGRNSKPVVSTSSVGFQRYLELQAGHKISLWRVVLAGIIVLVALTSLAVLIYGAVRNSILSIGRNPLAKQAIWRVVTGVIGMVVAISLVTCLAVFLLLK